MTAHVDMFYEYFYISFILLLKIIFHILYSEHGFSSLTPPRSSPTSLPTEHSRIVCVLVHMNAVFTEGIRSPGAGVTGCPGILFPLFIF